MFDDLTVLCGLSLKQLLDHHHTLSHHSLCEDSQAQHINTLRKLKTLRGSVKAFTVSVGEQQHQTVQTRVRHLRDVGGTPADGLNGGGRKRLVLTLHIRLNKDKETT